MARVLSVWIVDPRAKTVTISPPGSTHTYRDNTGIHEPQLTDFNISSAQIIFDRAGLLSVES